MRASILAASLVVVSPGAFAQSQSSSQPGLGYQSAHVETENLSRQNGGGRSECLVRKSDGKRECHTRAEWRQIAARLERSDGQSRQGARSRIE
jgi:hypothetical protein